MQASAVVGLLYLLIAVVPWPAAASGPVVPLTCDVPAAGAIENPLDSEFFSFDVSEGEIVSIRVVEDPSSGLDFEPSWRVLDGTGMPASECGFSSVGSQRDCGPLSASGNTYRVEVTDFFNDDTGSFMILLERLPSSTNCDQSALNCDIPAAGTSDSPLDSDFFSFDVSEGEIVSLRVVEDPSSGLDFEPSWRILDAAGMPAPDCGFFSVASQRDCGPLSATGNPYRVEITDFFNDDTGTYSILLERLPSSTNCDQSALGCDVSVGGTTDDPLDSDFFDLVVNEGELLSFRVVEDPSSGLDFEPSWRLLAGTGTPAPDCGFFSVASQNDCGPFSATGNPYRIEITDLFNDDIGTYSILFQRLTSTTACDQTPLECGVPISGIIDGPLDSDLFSFGIEENEIVSITVVEDPASGLDFEPSWRLLNGSGSPASDCGFFSVAMQRDCGPLATAGNPYRVEITDLFNDDIGGYDLSMVFLVGQCIMVPDHRIFRDGFESGNVSAWSNSVGRSLPSL